MFTSRLPISTSVRRPNNHQPDDGSTSFGSSRPSAIPKTVRKTNLFTPVTHRNGFSGASTTGKRSLSVMTTDKKYPRTLKPAPDRDAQMRMFDTLVDFLKQHAEHIPPPEAKKFFSSISTTELTRIFEALISCLLPEFKITRLEQDVPEALALLEYPYIRSVTKSSLVSVTTRQAVVGLLSIFYWLINFIRDNEPSSFDKSETSNDEQEIKLNIVLHNAPERIDEALHAERHRLYPIENYQDKLNELDSIRNESEELIQRLYYVDETTKEGHILNEDIEKCKEYDNQMQKYLQVKVDEREDKQQLSPRVTEQLDDIKREVEKLRLNVKTHELNIDEVREEKAKYDNLKSKLDNLHDQVHKSKTRIEQPNEISYNHLQDLKQDHNQLKELLGLLENVDGSAEWLLTFEQMSYDNLSIIRNIQSNFNSFMQEPEERINSLMLDSQKCLDEKEKLIQETKKQVSDTQQILLRSQDGKKRIDHEIERENGRHAGSLSQINTKLQEEEQIEAHNAKVASIEMDKYRKLLDSVNTTLEKSRVESDELVELRNKRIETALARYHQEAFSVAQEFREVAQHWQKVCMISEENNRIAKKAMKLLSKKLHM